MVKLKVDSAQLHETLTAARQTLLGRRNSSGHWEGELSASALSTAIAVAALAAYQQHSQESETDFSQLINNGLRWLVDTQNDDGGWGDTTKSFSNISTTAICWAAFAICRAEGQFEVCLEATERWLTRAAGSLAPSILSRRIAERYGTDRTFSVPILTTLAIGGRLGKGSAAWKHVPQLPFELAACPHEWFHRLRLPVVSYALPALIAIGQIRHHQLPSWNPMTRMLRNITRARTLRVLESVQPESGGFLEATPLTSFVVLSLALAGNADFVVTRNGVRFLVESVRADGSWPIDTNLATWVTTLAVNGLNMQPNDETALDEDAKKQILEWLLRQQYRVEHPYTHTPPGGWAWTDLTGGVPDADDTPGALLALSHLSIGTGEGRQSECCSAAEAGVRWLLNLQNRDGGMPTFCRGWGKLPFDRSSADLTAHTVRAWLAWRDRLSYSTQRRIDSAVDRAITFLASQQREDGSWVPLWFGNQHTKSEENPTYGTSRVLLAMPALAGKSDTASRLRVDRAVRWLLRAQNSDGGWGGDVDTPSTIEETSFAVEALACLLNQAEQGSSFGNPRSQAQPGNALRSRLRLGAGRQSLPSTESPGGDWERAERKELSSFGLNESAMAAAMSRGLDWLCENSAKGTRFPTSPIGFYFAKLWYFESLYPMVYAVAALGRVSALLGAPVVAAMRQETK